MNQIILPYVRRAWYHTMYPGELLRERVIFDYELIYIKEGKAVFTIEDHAYMGEPGDIFIFRPKCRHSIKVDPKGHLIQPHVHFDLIYRENRSDIPISFKNIDEITEKESRMFHPDILDDFCSPFPCHFHPHDIKYIEFLLFEVIGEFNHPVDHYDPYQELRIVRLFLNLWEQVVNEARYSLKPIKNPQKENAKRIRLYIEHHISRAITADELSKAVCLSQGYMFKIFQEFYKVSPMHYHSLLRIQRAKSMIRNTNMTITEVSNRLGYHNVQDFCRAFKKIDGFSPNSYKHSVLPTENPESV